MNRKKTDIKTKESVKKGKKSKHLSTQRYLHFAGAHDDCLILKDGGVRAIIEVGAVNFNLKSEEEQKAIIYTYQGFLNAIDFPVQIVIQSRKLDIDQYISDLKLKWKNQTNPLLKKQMEEYIQYIQKLVEFADIMDKRFLVSIPVNPPRSEKKGVWNSFWQALHPDDSLGDVIQRKKEFARLKKQIDERVNVVTTALSNCGLKLKRLSTEEIIELFYQGYNPLDSRYQKLKKPQEINHNGAPEERLASQDK